MSDPKQIIHIRIRDLRRERALTQEELAAALGISRQSINAMEAGRCLPSLPIALQIASFFSVPLGAVFEFPQLRRQGQEEPGAMTALMPWSPLREMQEALDELMDGSAGWQQSAQPLTVPAANIFHSRHQVTVQLFVPGYKKEQLSIEVEEEFVKVAGETHEEPERAYYRREVVTHNFQRVLQLPAPVEPAKAEAQMRDGILAITIPKLSEVPPKSAKISITSLD